MYEVKNLLSILFLFYNLAFPNSVSFLFHDKIYLLALWLAVIDFARKSAKSHKILRLIRLCLDIKMTFLTKQQRDMSPYIKIFSVLIVINVILERKNSGSKK